MARTLALVFALLVALVSPAWADERISSFVSDVTVNKDASLTVRETITLNAEGNQIRRGILRDFPTTYTDRRGVRVVVGFEVLGVTRDGQKENWSLESLSNGKRIRIGSADVILPFGQHTYEITYRTTRQLGFFDTYDELYWNVTGNDWTFPIDEATAIIRLPPGARIQQHAEYTGFQGAQGKDFEVLNASGAEYRARTTRGLIPGQGFTVAVGWQKGIVTPPSDSDKWGWWISDNAGIFALILSLMVSAAYYLFAWDRVGRDPPKGTIIPLFTPPAGLGPAGARFVRKQGFDDRGFAAAVVSLAVKGYLKITDDDSNFSITRLSSPRKTQPLSVAESALLSSIPSGTTVLKQSNHGKIRPARSRLLSALSQEYEGSVFIRNLRWFWGGAIISVLGLLVSALLLPGGDGMLGLFAVGWTSIWWGVVLSFAWTAVKGLINDRGILKKLTSVFLLFFLIPFFFGGFAGPAVALMGGGSPVTLLLIAAAVLMGIMNLVFFYLLRAPTGPGRKLLDQIEGFRMYMTTAEEDRLNVLHPPEKTPELFERYLPYALALDCENEWNAKFATVLAAAAMAGAAAPAWYSGRNWDSRNMGSFTDSLGSSLASSVRSAPTAPGSSSGSFGGGSSGGGGGGGGGSGW
ncbi:MAG: DUF2207 domain-containing protein [Alphaproteobacteria bacterium]|nr:DUF2207 domain-containing protein [Alphaproteobacteria bacterium]